MDILSLNLNNILENFIADAFIAIIFGLFLTWLFEWRRRAKLEMLIVLEPPSVANQNHYWADIRIRNNGLTAFKEKEVNWHIYWSNSLDVRFLILEKYPHEFVGQSYFDEENYKHLRDYTILPLFPEREITILRFEFIEKPVLSKIKVRYHFSTIFGLKPKFVWNGFRYIKLQDKFGSPKLEKLPSCRLDLSALTQAYLRELYK